MLIPTADFHMTAELQTVSDFIAAWFEPHPYAKGNGEPSSRIHPAFETEM